MPDGGGHRSSGKAPCRLRRPWRPGEHTSSLSAYRITALRDVRQALKGSLVNRNRCMSMVATVRGAAYHRFAEWKATIERSSGTLDDCIPYQRLYR